MQRTLPLVNDSFIAIDDNYDDTPVFKAIYRHEKELARKGRGNNNIYKPPRVIAIHKYVDSGNGKYFELEIEGNVESSYIVKLLYSDNYFYGACFCRYFLYRKKPCKHILASIIFIKNNFL